jgi:hypothetical protein
MASIGQLELWQQRAKTRVDKYKNQVKEETAKKKTLLRPKSPQQVKTKETIVKKILRSREELEHSKKRLKEIELELKEARKNIKASAPKSPKSVGKVLSKKFSKTTAVHSDAKLEKVSKAAHNKIELDIAPTLEKDKNFRLLQDIMGVLNGLDTRLKIVEQKADDRHQNIVNDIDIIKSKLNAINK